MTTDREATRNTRPGVKGFIKVDMATRFWASVDRSGECWLWLGTLSRWGYGRFYREGRNVAAHRVAWELENGEPIPPGLYALHRCDNPPCVRPVHIFLGTAGDNARDAVAKARPWNKGNGMRGADSPLSRISDEKSLEIYRRHHAGETRKALAQEYGISKSSVGEICTASRRWSWITK